MLPERCWYIFWRMTKKEFLYHMSIISQKSKTLNQQLIEEYCLKNNLDFDSFCIQAGINLQISHVQTKQRREPFRHPEEAKVSHHLDRALVENLPATLTLEQWLHTLDYFNQKCAYCQQSPYVSLDHFLPIILNGGTTAKNCVPACKSCNARKSSLLPEKIKSIPSEDIRRVRRYLESL